MLGRDKICAVVAAADSGTMLRQLRLALRQTRTVELRLDWLSGDREIARFLSRLRSIRPKATLIATCRRREAGGKYSGTIASQLAQLLEAIGAGCEWFDLEIESVRQCPPGLLEIMFGEGLQLTSAHFFDRLPKDLAQVAGELARGRSDAIKIAAHCKSLREARKIFAIASKRKNVVAIPMGDVALPARLLAVREGSVFTYAPVENATAPGQVSLNDAKQLYRLDRLTHRTRVYGVIGNPVGHSLSPLMQNAGFAARRLDAIYLPFLVRDLRDFVDSIEPLDISGFSVTIPHKRRILKYLDRCDPLAEKIGAVNTVVRSEGKLCGYNTDYVGVLRSLESRMPLRGSRILIVGAGGAARAVAFALAQSGGVPCITARRPARARALARAAGGEAIPRQRIRAEFFDAIVNATPVGMHPRTGESPLEPRELNCRLVFDTIYRPKMTKLLQFAKRRGIETVSGVEMFVAQGAAQIEIWTGQRAPVEAMRRAVLGALVREEIATGKRAQQRNSRAPR
ncbi:MAG: shikimate dehydrogenase [Acidobacteriota bacterium]|nr:shikimate dehydrogenase [Acidobacteriota bacterium]MDE3170278.1 shikimate dehydrogenase [Acidobacteriota bacterium]